MADEDFLDKKLNERREQHAFRQLRLPDGKIDFCSNDYLGIATHGLIGLGLPDTLHPLHHGSGGSRLLAGNYPLIEETERTIAAFHQAATGLIFNSGYDANLGVLSCIPQRGDSVLYDQLSHASIRDGVRLSFARSFSFAHNNLEELEQRLRSGRGVDESGQIGEDNGQVREESGQIANENGQIFVVTESVFSMDGDQAPLPEIVALCRRYGAQLIVDEAHATGVVGSKGEGLVQALGLQADCLARIHTFGKAVGCHGAIVLGSPSLRDFLINYSRAFIYTTALPETSVWAIQRSYELFPRLDAQRARLRQLIERFRQAKLGFDKLNSLTPIQAVIVPGNEAVRELAAKLQTEGLDVRPILYPTVPKGGERLRIVLHSFNEPEHLDRLIHGLQ